MEILTLHITHDQKRGMTNRMLAHSLQDNKDTRKTKVSFKEHINQALITILTIMIPIAATNTS